MTGFRNDGGSVPEVIALTLLIRVSRTLRSRVPAKNRAVSGRMRETLTLVQGSGEL